MLAVLVYLTSLRLSFIFHGLDFALIRPAIGNAGLAIENVFFQAEPSYTYIITLLRTTTLIASLFFFSLWRS
jgi:hypothetical protein